MLRSLRHCEPGLGPGEAIQSGYAHDSGLPRRLQLLAMTIFAGATFLAMPAAAQQRATVDASAPQNIAVTVYRDPNRAPGDQLDRDWPQGFAMISETRTVTLPPGESTIRFTGVAEGMVAVSAIVTGLPGGTIEKNRNADLLSPAALVDGTLGNRIRITRTNPATGAEETEPGVIRTRADGGLVLQTTQGYEAVRCSGLLERLSFPAVPDGLSPQPVFSIDTRDASGGTYQITLSYLAWGFDWQANYVATVDEADGEDVTLRMVSWLTIVNYNGQSFADAELLTVAGRLNVTSDYKELAEPPVARPLRLTCYPLGSTAAGTPIISQVQYRVSPAPPPPAPVMMRAVAEESLADAEIVVTAQMRMAEEEDLGDLKLYRMPVPVTVAAQSLKQVAFLDKPDVTGRMLYTSMCAPGDTQDTAAGAGRLFVTVNDEEHGLGAALPTGSIAFFEPSRFGDLLVGEETLRDYATGQDVEIALGESAQVFARCEAVGDWNSENRRWHTMRATLTNANPYAVTMRLYLGLPTYWDARGLRTRVKDGQRIGEVTVPANGSRVVEWQVRRADEG